MGEMTEKLFELSPEEKKKLPFMKRIGRWTFEFVSRSKGFRFFFLFKFYMNVALVQINWFLSKGPEIMSIVYFLEKAGVYLSLLQIFGGAFIGFCIIALFGLIIRKVGWYDKETYIDAEINPVLRENILASRAIMKEVLPRLKKIEKKLDKLI